MKENDNDDIRNRNDLYDQDDFDEKENFGTSGEIDDDGDYNDIFNEEIPEQKPKEKKVKPPKLKREDPRYWDQEESRWEHLRPSRPAQIGMWCAAIVLGTGLIWWLWIQLFGTNVDMAAQYGYVEKISKEGRVFKTFEGVMIPYREITDTTRNYDRDFVFSVENDTISAFLVRMEKSGKPVRVEYKVYNTALPWRGNSRIMVIAADTADPNRILPPEFTPRRE